MLKKISSLAAGGYGYHSSSRPLQVRRRSLDDDQLRRHSQTNPNDDSGTDGKATICSVNGLSVMHLTVAIHPTGINQTTTGKQEPLTSAFR